METKTVELLWWESQSIRFHKDNKHTLILHTTVRTSANVKLRFTGGLKVNRGQKIFFPLAYFHRSTLSQEILNSQWVVAWVQNTNFIPNTFMTMTTAEEGNHFYFGPQTGSKSPESLVSRSRELHTVYKETISPLRSISSMGVNLKTQNIVICTEKCGWVMRRSWIHKELDNE